MYTLESAGWEGFATILPVYLDHLILPTLTDAGCYTEVHHVDGTGHDAGVVYSEMQATQNTSDDILDLKAKRLIYPESVGYRYETGGLMERLRVLTADRIREFHREMYQPKNLCLVLIGEVNQPHLLQILDRFEDNILQEVPRLDEPFRRPWVESGKTPKLQESSVETVEFPEEDESIGEILINYLGPDCNDDLMCVALDVFLVYICGSSISLLENVLVEKEQLASAVYYETVTRPDVLVKFTLSGVETKKLQVVEKRFHEVLTSAVSTPLDMSYMMDCLHRNRRQLKFVTETSGRHFGDGIIYDHLYGKRDGSQLRSIATLKEYNILQEWNEKSWRDFFRRWFIDAHYITVIGQPSKSFSEQLEKEEEARVERQQKDLGQEGLQKLARRLQEAKAENERDIPKELLEQFPVPGTSSVHFIPTTTSLAGLARPEKGLDNRPQRVIDHDTDNLPLYLHFEHIPTNFVSLGLLMNTHAVPEELRPLLLIYMTSFFDTPVIRNGVRMEYEEVVTQLERDTIGFGIGTGAGVGNGELLRISFQVEPEKYSTAIEWMRTMLYHSIFDTSRLVSSIAKMIATVPEEKRSGSSMAYSVSDLLFMTRKSTPRAQNTLVKAQYLRGTLMELENDPKVVLLKFEKIRQILARPPNFRVFVIADLESSKISAPVSSWTALASAAKPSEVALQPLDSVKETLSEAGKKPGHLAFVVPMRTIDSSFALLTCRGPGSLESPDLPALAVAQAYLDAVEGPLWASVRGTGLAYGTGFSRSISSGLLYFNIYRSPDACKAFASSKKTVVDLASGNVEIDELALEGAVSSIVVGFANEQPTMLSAASVSFENQVIKGIPKDWGTGFMKKVRDVGQEDVKRVLKDIILPIFDAKTSNLVVTCAGVMGDKMMKSFEQEGFTPEVRPLSWFKDGYGMQGVDEDDEDDEESERDDGYEEDEEQNEDNHKDTVNEA